MAEQLIWIDTDCGFDDLCAISLLDDYSLQFPRKLKIGFISSVNGMTNPVMGQSVIKKLFRSASYACQPIVACGRESQFNQMNSIQETDWGSQYINDFSAFVSNHLDIIDQADGKSDQPADHRNKQGEDDIERVVFEIMKLGEAQKVTLLCLGPLTNIANILRRHPTFLIDHIERIVLMGGAVLVNGNAPDNSEYNFYLDPEAAAYVLQNCKIPIEMLGLEVANDIGITKDQYKQLISYIESDDKVDDKTDENFQPKNMIRQVALQSKDSLSYDPIVSYYLMNSGAFTFENMKIKINPQTGCTRREVSNGIKDSLVLDAVYTSLQDSVDIRLAVSFRKQEYYNYLRSKIFM